MAKTFRRREAAKPPVLVNVLVDPEMFEGEPVQFRLLLKFSTGHGFVDIVAMKGTDGEEIERQAIEIKRALGIA